MSDPTALADGGGQVQFLRKAGLFISAPPKNGNNPSAYVAGQTRDLSAMHFSFKTTQQEVESPDSVDIRVYNLSQKTVDEIRQGEFGNVVLQAGYANNGVGIIFQGDIKQYRTGRLNATDTYFDILAADGDLAYNFARIGVTLAAGSTPLDGVNAVMTTLAANGVAAGYQMAFTGGVLPRGKVLFGLSRAALRQQVQSQGAQWNINNGVVNIIPLSGYLPGEAVVLNSATGLIGRPEQTDNGVNATCLLNPRIQVGSLFKIDNTSVNQILQADGSIGPSPAYNQFKGIQNLAYVAADGLYQAIVVEHEGDTRGQAWYTHLVGLAIDPSTSKVIAPR